MANATQAAATESPSPPQSPERVMPEPRRRPKIVSMSSVPSPIIISEPLLDGFLARYPMLTRKQVLHTIVVHGPDRQRVEAELLRLAGRAEQANPAP